MALEDAFLQSFDTQAGVPGFGGIIPANSTLTFTLWLMKTANFGTVFPRVSAGLNWPSGPSLCSPANGTTAITTTQASYTVNCSTGASDITMTATDRIWISVGYHMTAGPGAQTMKVELDIECTLWGGASDSRGRQFWCVSGRRLRPVQRDDCRDHLVVDDQYL